MKHLSLSQNQTEIRGCLMTHLYENSSSAIPAINFFVTPTCNMKCRFCFGKFNIEPPDGKVDLRKLQIDVIQACADAGIEKITFVGGEPLLSPWIDEEITLAHDLGMCTCVVTNGSIVTKEWIQRASGTLDWIGISIDSLQPETNLDSGRAVKNLPISEANYRQMIEWIHKEGIKLKINTTVTRWNCDEDMVGFLRWASPERMKIFQALTIDNVNTVDAETFSVSDQKFFEYVERHRLGGVAVIAESAMDMKGSYLMLTPNGRFFENIEGNYRYSSRISDVGYGPALSEIRISMEKFQKRGGLYDWT